MGIPTTNPLNDQLNKMTLAFASSLTRSLKDIYYDADREMIFIKMQEENCLFELELDETLHRIKCTE